MKCQVRKTWNQLGSVDKNQKIVREEVVRYPWLLFVLVFLVVWAVNLEASGEVQEETSTQVISALRTNEIIKRDFRASPPNDEVRIMPKYREKDVFLVVRIGSIEYELWEVAGKNGEIFIVDDQSQYNPETMTVSYRMGAKDNCYILVFIVPRTTLNYDLMVAGHSTPFEAKAEIAEQLKESELCR